MQADGGEQEMKPQPAVTAPYDPVALMTTTATLVPVGAAGV